MDLVSPKKDRPWNDTRTCVNPQFEVNPITAQEVVRWEGRDC